MQEREKQFRNISKMDWNNILPFIMKKILAKIIFPVAYNCYFWPTLLQFISP